MNNPMVSEAVITLVAEMVGIPNIFVNEPMKRHTTFRVGGPADLLITPQGILQLESIIKLLKQMKVPYLVIGNGSNLLVGDRGIRGAVIQVTEGISHCNVDGEILSAEAGIKLSKLAGTALNNGLAGLEFAAGIPGTLGGAIYMNAGAYGGEMKDVISEVTYLNEDQIVDTLSGDHCCFGYRHSYFSDGNRIILGCKLRLKNGDVQLIKAKMDELNGKRTEKQPLNKPSAGSTFKRPEGYFAGKLIQNAGLKGYRIGGASVSEKHSGFVINDGDATAEDVRNLIEHIQNTVEDQFGVRLETEVKFVGEF